MQIRVDEDKVRDELEYRLEAFVLTDHIATDQFHGATTAEWPATTWQMFKAANADTWWLGWLVRRYPVRMHLEHVPVTVEVERYLNYPEANLHLPELGRPVVFEQASQVPRD